MKRGLETILLSSFVVIFLATFFPGVASANLYFCINQQTKQVIRIQSPNQCIKPSILRTYTDADIAKLKTTTPSIVQSQTATKSRRTVAIEVDPSCTGSYTCYWQPITKTCGYYFCICAEPNPVMWISGLEGQCTPTDGGTSGIGTKPRTGVGVPLK